MQTKAKTDQLHRNRILSMLSDEEVANVSRAETEAQLVIGDEFVDLGNLDKGVQRAGKAYPRNNLVPKKSVHEKTWREIVTSLNATYT